MIDLGEAEGPRRRRRRKTAARLRCAGADAISAVLMEDWDLEFVLAASPVLQVVAVAGNLQLLRARLATQNLKCVQFCNRSVVPRPEPSADLHLEMLRPTSQRKNQDRHATELIMMGYMEAGVHELEIGNTIISLERNRIEDPFCADTSSLALRIHFRVRKAIKMLPSFVKCFPNFETIEPG